MSPPAILATISILWALNLLLIAALFVPLARELRQSRPLCVLLTVAGCVYLTYVPPELAARLPISDSIEYAAAAIRFVTEGRYEIVVQGTALPPRYSPWFSLLTLAPVYSAAPHSIGAGILPVTFFSTVGLLAAFALGQRLAGPQAGLAALLLVWFANGYRYFSTMVMTDVPGAAVFLVACLYYLTLREGKFSLRNLFGAAVLCAYAAALRPVNAVWLLPFALLLAFNLRGAARLRAAAVLAAPSLLVALLTAAYNLRTFGTVARSGYAFWLSVPYDYFFLTFSPSYVALNLPRVFMPSFCLLGILAAAAIFTPRALQFLAPSLDPSRVRTVAAYTAAAGGPLTVAYLFYFYSTSRFYLPLFSITAVLASPALGALLSRIRLPLPVLLTLCLAGAISFSRPPPPSQAAAERWQAAEAVKDIVPQGGAVISGINPLFFWLTLSRTGGWTEIPVSRQVPFTQTFAAPKSVFGRIPDPKGPLDRSALETLEDTFRVVPHVALDLEWLELQVRKGQVYLEAFTVLEEEITALKQRFELQLAGPGIFRVREKVERSRRSGL